MANKKHFEILISGVGKWNNWRKENEKINPFPRSGEKWNNWMKENEKFFETFTDDPQAAEDVAFMANDLGSDVAVDSQGRLLLSPELRRELSLENQAVRLLFYKGRIDVYSENLYAERKQQASQGRKEKILTLERKGLK